MTAPECPICGKLADPAHRPFCSRGCRDRDLLRWFGEDYRIPGREPTDGLDKDAEPD